MTSNDAFIIWLFSVGVATLAGIWIGRASVAAQLNDAENRIRNMVRSGYTDAE